MNDRVCESASGRTSGHEDGTPIKQSPASMKNWKVLGIGENNMQYLLNIKTGKILKFEAK